MSHFGNVPAQTLADALEKHVAKMDDARVASVLRDGLADMPQPALEALVASIFDAFRDRGESSEDAAEGANADLDRLERGERGAIESLLTYAAENTGLLKEALTVYAEQHAHAIDALPKTLVDGISERL
jgi:hypothetical protein